MRVVLSSVPVADADKIANALVEARLVACVSVVPNVVSTYRWRGVVERSDEALLVMKTADDKLDALMAALPKLHPYEVPEIVALRADDGEVFAPYLAWVVDETR